MQDAIVLFVLFLYGDIIRMVTILGIISTKFGVKKIRPSLFGKLIIMGDKVLTPKFPKCLRGSRHSALEFRNP